MPEQKGFPEGGGGNFDAEHEEGDVLVAEHDENTKSPERSRASWRDLREALSAVWDIANEFSEEEATGTQGAELLEENLRKRHTEFFDTLEGTLELADQSESKMKDTFQDLIALARQHQKDYFVHQVTDASKASGSAKELFEAFAKGLNMKVSLEAEESVEEDQEKAA